MWVDTLFDFLCALGSKKSPKVTFLFPNNCVHAYPLPKDLVLIREHQMLSQDHSPMIHQLSERQVRILQAVVEMRRKRKNKQSAIIKDTAAKYNVSYLALQRALKHEPTPHALLPAITRRGRLQ